MPSNSWQKWNTTAQVALDEIEAAHSAIGGTLRGRRYATQQINQAYVVLLASQFQAFARDLHSEAVDHLVDFAPETLKSILRTRLTEGRKLDQGNANPGNIGSDFSRFGYRLWDKVREHDGRTPARFKRLETLNLWRNAVAHQDFDREKLGGRTTVRLAMVQQWRSACRGLALSFDAVARDQVARVVGATPWT